MFLQVCECCARTPLNACFHLFAPPTTTSLVFRAWWRDCVRLWVPHSASWIKPLTTNFLLCLRLQVLLCFATHSAATVLSAMLGSVHTLELPQVLLSLLLFSDNTSVVEKTSVCYRVSLRTSSLFFQQTINTKKFKK